MSKQPGSKSRRRYFSCGRFVRKKRREHGERGGMTRSKKALVSSIYRMKIVLSRIKPPVWRRLEVPGDVKLSRLRSIFLEGMGWMDSHLHRFVIDGVS
jgi:Plasmid pRiA4b ORF-3-like protein